MTAPDDPAKNASGIDDLAKLRQQFLPAGLSDALPKARSTPFIELIRSHAKAQISEGLSFERSYYLWVLISICWLFSLKRVDSRDKLREHASSV